MQCIKWMPHTCVASPITLKCGDRHCAYASASRQRAQRFTACPRVQRCLSLHSPMPVPPRLIARCASHGLRAWMQTRRRGTPPRRSLLQEVCEPAFKPQASTHTGNRAFKQRLTTPSSPTLAAVSKWWQCCKVCIEAAQAISAFTEHPAPGKPALRNILHANWIAR